MATIPRVITYEEWLTMPTVEDGTDEVVKGKYRFMPPTHYPHAEIIQRIISKLVRQTNEDQVVILGSNFGLIISRDPLTCRSPDLALYWKGNDRIVDGLHVAPPDLIVEIISPSENRRRKEGKMEDYASIGVPEAWLISPEAENIEIRMLRNGRLERTTILADGSLQPTRFPGVSIPVASIWPEPKD
jgi:Uma2 family endonuclease